MLPLLSSRGCFWGKCIFCDHSYVYNQIYRARDVELVIKDIIYYVNEYCVKNINFHGEAMNSRCLSELSDAINQNKINIKWTTCARIEAGLNPEVLKQAKEAGLTILFFGLESTNDRTLKAMNKGITIENSMKILQKSSDLGIWNHVFIICGFPTETLEEFINTLKTIQKNSQIFLSVGLSFFDLVKFSPIAEQPKGYGIEVQNTKNDLSLSHAFLNMNNNYEDIRQAYNSIDSVLVNKKYKYCKYIFREHWPIFSDNIYDASKIFSNEVLVLGANKEKYYVVSEEMQVYAIDKLSFIIMNLITKIVMTI